MGSSGGVVVAREFRLDVNELAWTLAAPARLNAVYRDEIRLRRSENEPLHRVGKHRDTAATKPQMAKR